MCSWLMHVCKWSHSATDLKLSSRRYCAAADLIQFIFVVVGRHTVCPAPLGDDHHCAHRWPAGRLPAQQEHPVHYQRQENHELWR